MTHKIYVVMDTHDVVQLDYPDPASLLVEKRDASASTVYLTVVTPRRSYAKA